MALSKFNPELVVVGGLQLMEVDIDEKRRISRLQELSSVLQNLYVRQIPVHFEFAAASGTLLYVLNVGKYLKSRVDFVLYNDIRELVLPWVNSIGVNEQELFILHHFLERGEHQVSTSSRPTLIEVGKQLTSVIDYAARMRRETGNSEALGRLDRIHFHSLEFHILCQRSGSSWADGRDALVQGAMATTKSACGESKRGRKIKQMQVKAEDIELLLPRKVPFGLGSVSEFLISPRAPINSWTHDEFECLMVPVMVCKSPDHTAGLGDNISGSGLAYHRYGAG